MHWKVKTKSGTIFNPGLALIGLSWTPGLVVLSCSCLWLSSICVKRILWIPFLPSHRWGFPNPVDGQEVQKNVIRTGLPDSSLTLTLSNNLPQCWTFPDNLVPGALFPGSFSDTFMWSIPKLNSLQVAISTYKFSSLRLQAVSLFL